MSAIEEHLRRVRPRVRRVRPEEAASLAASGGLLVDTRPASLRRREGAVPGALVIERNELEWRLDPTSPWRHPAVRAGDVEQPVVVLCDEGFASTLAVASLQTLGLCNVADLDGGFQAWRGAGLPVVAG